MVINWNGFIFDSGELWLRQRQGIGSYHEIRRLSVQRSRTGFVGACHARSRRLVQRISDRWVRYLINTNRIITDNKYHIYNSRYPREKSQGAAFEKIIAPVDIILYFECKAETMVARILKRAEQSAVKREDDNEATIRTRIETFVRNTDEILVQYPAQTRRVSAF